MSIPTLHDLAARRLARAVAAQLDAEIFIHYTTNSDGADIIEKSRIVFDNLGIGPSSNAPAFVLTAVRPWLQKNFPSAYLLWSSFQLDQFDSIELPRNVYTLRHCPRHTTASLSAIASNMKSSITRIEIASIGVDDNFLTALAASPAAPTLTALSFDRCTISDASSGAWEHFQNLQKVELRESHVFHMKTVEAICKLKHLCELHLFCDLHYCEHLDPAEVIECMTKYECNNILYLSLGSEPEDEWIECDPDFMDALFLWPGCSNLLSYKLGPFTISHIYEGEYVFEFLPQLQAVDDMIHWETVEEYLDGLTRLTHLMLRDVPNDEEHFTNFMEDVGHSLTALESLSVFFSARSGGWSWLATMPHLHTLELFDKGESGLLIEQIPWPASLTTLRLILSKERFDYSRETIESLLEQLCSLPGSLEDLSLGPADSFTPQDFELILASLPNLTRLVITSSNSRAPPHLEELAISHPNLRKIHINSAEYLYPRFRHVPCLDKIAVFNEPSVRALFHSLNSGHDRPSFPSLKLLHVHMSADWNISDADAT
eukprot:TRINITY_DN4933_c0_g1_i1.p1 TRINITY_DN4933_c0_g1~~TRINITY_DN4933_c0_g1_i1.p1  ORF type:complete len:544 (-),score=64.43 TRINITY_DN4933_c0_g1_i1:752-2383(-)